MTVNNFLIFFQNLNIDCGTKSVISQSTSNNHSIQITFATMDAVYRELISPVQMVIQLHGLYGKLILKLR